MLCLYNLNGVIYCVKEKMACNLFGTKPLPEPILKNRQMELRWNFNQNAHNLQDTDNSWTMKIAIIHTDRYVSDYELLWINLIPSVEKSTPGSNLHRYSARLFHSPSPVMVNSHWDIGHGLQLAGVSYHLCDWFAKYRLGVPKYVVHSW